MKTKKMDPVDVIAGLELGYLFRAHAAFRPTYPIYPLSGEVAVAGAWANVGAWSVRLSRCSLLLAWGRRILLPTALREQLNRCARAASCGFMWRGFKRIRDRGNQRC